MNDPVDISSTIDPTFGPSHVNSGVSVTQIPEDMLESQDFREYRWSQYIMGYVGLFIAVTGVIGKFIHIQNPANADFSDQNSDFSDSPIIPIFPVIPIFPKP